MEKSKLGFVLFSGEFEDTATPTPTINIGTVYRHISPKPPLLPPTSPSGLVPYLRLLYQRGEDTRKHLASFNKPKKVKVTKLPMQGRKGRLEVKTNRKGKKKSLQERIMECKTPEEMESVLILEGIIKIDS